MTRLQTQVARGRQNSRTFDWGQWYLSGRRLNQLRSVVSLWFLLMALDVWKEVSGVESMLATLLVPNSSDCTILAIICVPGTS
ncbi:hypothetical protein TNCV_2569911 [Trichonephila clavipes]|nr:hypothetical protein TNCV_2569911 [Trichonephila clavipes]